MKEEYKYLKIRIRGEEEIVDVFDDLESANRSAEEEWNAQTACEMVWTTMKVVKVFKSDVDGDWKLYKIYHQPENEEFFDSDLF